MNYPIKVSPISAADEVLRRHTVRDAAQLITALERFKVKVFNSIQITSSLRRRLISTEPLP